MRLCSVSIDLDEVSCYSQIHGLESTPGVNAVYDVALPRIRAFAADTGLPVTLFVVANDLGRADNVEALRGFVAAGHEIGNHSVSHLYDLSRRPRAEQERQIDGANLKLARALGVEPKGFRAPGYTVTDQLLAVVRDCGLRYDSSVFPCPLYFAAKAARLAHLKLAGRTSWAVLDTPRVLSAPIIPYRVGSPYWRPGAGLLELPIQVAGPLRAPFIGTALSLLGPTAARWLTRSLFGAPLVNLELHGIDFLDAQDLPHSIAVVQPDVRVPWRRKLETFASVLELLRKNGYAAVRLDEAAQVFS